MVPTARCEEYLALIGSFGSNFGKRRLGPIRFCQRDPIAHRPFAVALLNTFRWGRGHLRRLSVEYVNRFLVGRTDQILALGDLEREFIYGSVGLRSTSVFMPLQSSVLVEKSDQGALVRRCRYISSVARN